LSYAADKQTVLNDLPTPTVRNNTCSAISINQNQIENNYLTRNWKSLNWLSTVLNLNIS